MNDRELLEMAAKAAGVELVGGSRTPMVWENGFPLDYMREWRPLADDGDALRLAVRLGIEYGFGYNRDGTIQRVIVDDDCYVIVENDDPCAATRRAIVRAAAEIGRAMP